MLDTPRLLLLIVGAVTLLLGLALWALDLDKRANRAFAALLALKGATLGLYQVPSLAPGTAAFVFSTLPYLVIPLIPLAWYFASVFPRRRGWLGAPGGGWWLLGIVVGLWLLYFVRHDWFWSVSSTPASHPHLQAVAGQLAFDSYGPMSLLLWGAYPVFGCLALLFIMDYAKTSAGPQRLSHFLVGVGFLINAIFDGVSGLRALVDVLAQPQGYPIAPWGWAAVWLRPLSIVPAAAALAYMSWHRFGQRTQERAMERRAYALAAVAVVAAGLPLVAEQVTLYGATIYLIILALLRLALPAAVTYGLLRYSLFDIDLRVRRGIGYALMASIFGGVYFVVSEQLEGRVADTYGNLGGLAAAALLTLIGVPLSRLTQAIARFLMPATADMTDAAKLYSAQFMMLNEDGQLTAKERRCLDQLRERLGLSLQQAQRLEAV